MEAKDRCQQCRRFAERRDKKGRLMPCLDCTLEGKTGLRRFWAWYRWMLRAEVTEEDRQFLEKW